jgi:hypothetical protein
MKDVYVLEYSKSQDCFHIQTIEDLVASDQYALAQELKLDDYRIVGAGTREECDGLCREYIEILASNKKNKGAK